MGCPCWLQSWLPTTLRYPFWSTGVVPAALNGTVTDRIIIKHKTNWTIRSRFFLILTSIPPGWFLSKAPHFLRFRGFDLTQFYHLLGAVSIISFTALKVRWEQNFETDLQEKIEFKRILNNVRHLQNSGNQLEVKAVSIFFNYNKI